MADRFTTQDEIIGWAKKTVDANGSLYTSLTKSEQFNIANFILKQANIKDEPKDEAGDGKLPPPPAEVAIDGKRDAAIEDKRPVEPVSKIVPTADQEKKPGQPYATTDGTVTEAPADGDGEQRPFEDAEGVPAAKEPDHPTDTPRNDCEGVVATTDDRKESVIRVMSRRQDLARRGKDAQAAYDEFLQWQAENRNTHVMDFSKGTYHNSAAFAYWLTEMISVEIPDDSQV